MDKVLVKFPLTIKAKLTEKLKSSMLNEIEAAVNQAELEVSQINIQLDRALQQAKDESDETKAMIQRNYGAEIQKRQDFIAQNKVRHKELTKMQLGAEVVQGQTERFVELKVGDNVRDQFNVEVVVEDDKIIAIRS